MPGTPVVTAKHSERIGAIYALVAYAWWGFIPIYFKQVAEVSAPEIIVHRIVWSAVCTGLVILVARRGRLLRTLLATPQRLAMLGLSAACIGCNWLLFAWAVTHEHVLDTSLGYFINPLLTVALGVVLLRERLRPAQYAAVGIAAAGVILFALRHGALPWIALGLAFTFGGYSLLRKRIPVDPVSGLLVETLFLFPFAALYFLYLWSQRQHCFGAGDVSLSAWLMLAGPVTTIPLLFFAAGARRLRLSTLGFLQYLTPSLTFLLALFAYHEAFGLTQCLTFACIWAALLIYTVDTLHSRT